jgi:hypothetical protein
MARPRKYNFNENYFENIDTEEKAYWLGFFFADGCITINKKGDNKQYLQYKIQLTSIDVEVIENFSKVIGYSNSKISVYKDKYYYLHLTSKKMFDDLSALKCTERKSLTLTFPNIDQIYISHFIRGYFDGDGSISTRDQNVKFKNHIAIYKNANINFCGTLEFLTELKFKLPFLSNSNLKIEKDKRKSTNCYNLRFSGYKRVKLFYDYIYTNSLFLFRKNEKFKQFFKERASTTIIGNPIRGPYKNNGNLRIKE